MDEVRVVESVSMMAVGRVGSLGNVRITKTGKAGRGKVIGKIEEKVSELSDSVASLKLANVLMETKG